MFAAFSYNKHMKSLIIVVSGAVGAGKSTLSQTIGEKFGLPIIGRDEIKETLFNTIGWSNRSLSEIYDVAAYALLRAYP
jgi:2-phosphoglycerate kinase